MHGYREDLYLLILKCARYFKHLCLLIHTKNQDGLEVYDPTTGKTVRYETFVPRSKAPYSKSACDKLQTGWISSESDEISDPGSLSDSENPDLNLPSSSYIDDDDEFADTVRWVRWFSIFICIDSQRQPPFQWYLWYFNNWESELRCCRSYVSSTHFWTDRRAVRRRLGSFHNSWPSETMGWPSRSFAFPCTYLLRTYA